MVTILTQSGGGHFDEFRSDRRTARRAHSTRTADVPIRRLHHVDARQVEADESRRSGSARASGLPVLRLPRHRGLCRTSSVELYSFVQNCN